MRNRVTDQDSTRVGGQRECAVLASSITKLANWPTCSTPCWTSTSTIRWRGAAPRRRQSQLDSQPHQSPHPQEGRRGADYHRSGRVVRSAVELAEFQEEAAKKARRILAKYDGVLSGDSVGMGKTWIGKKLLENYAYHQQMKALVVCPASLREMWRRKLTITAYRCDVLCPARDQTVRWTHCQQRRECVTIHCG
jgi:hypothetical protein